MGLLDARLTKLSPDQRMMLEMRLKPEAFPYLRAVR